MAKPSPKITIEYAHRIAEPEKLASQLTTAALADWRVITIVPIAGTSTHIAYLSRTIDIPPPK
jgi:hypothetical protein